ncbi:SMP-30/gluconolactonase/LRE family protein [Prauserella muralis]|uniref:Gluconolaconase n=1 Tax=Prauserella muralis TaxID=588067 RepID=A0A2V4AZG3_9PSEU|nr:SMP-30/gluconolactonase/LRE family protein [Prauserella muralis]PXY27380.1 gluconolaconase [Prauserella muralis]TWE22931.1 sugar lactone lactonase YvrE [Prauserella muralis]
MTTDADPVWSAWPGERFELGEGLRYWQHRLLFVDILSGRLFELPDDADHAPRMVAELPEPLGAVAPLAGGGWIAAAGTGVGVLGDDGRLRWIARPEEGAAFRMRMNDAVADPHGRFWAGSMAYDGAPGAGSLYRLDADGSLHRALEGLTVPNGPAFSADGATMYLADSARGVIHRYAVDEDTGELGGPTEFATLSSGSPDGMTVDAEGFLWSAVWGAGRVCRFAPDGTLDRVVPVPAVQPTSVCLTGDRLVVTSARIGLDDPGDSDGAVLSTPLDQLGVPACVATVAGG